MSLRHRLLTLLQPRHEEHVAHLAAALARHCRESVHGSVCEKAAQMSRDMARGYLRAHASHCVAARLDAVTIPSNGGERIRSKVASAAVAQLISAVMRDLASVNVSPRMRAAA